MLKSGALAVLITLAAHGPTRSGEGRAGAFPAATCETTADTRFQEVYRRSARLLGQRASLSEDDFRRQAESIIRDSFALDVMGREILGDTWAEAGPHGQERFTAALVSALRSRVLTEVGPPERLPALTRADAGARRDGDVLEIPYLLGDADGRDALSVRMVAQSGGGCGIVDLRGGGRALLKALRDQVKRDMTDYSFTYAVAELGGGDFVVLEDFEATEVGEMPHDWTWRGSDDKKSKPYRGRLDAGNKYLEATDRGESVILGREIRWDLDKYPYVSFRVRVRAIPEGGNERYDDLVDSAAGLYFTVNKKFFGKIPESVKYVWSSTLPVGVAVRREGIGRPWQVVFGSGREGLGEWRTYVFDLRQAYRDTFGGSAPSKAEGIGILSDANSLMSEAFADYDDIRALRSAPAGVGSGVLEILPPLGHS